MNRLWPEDRAARITEKARAFADRRPPTFTFVPSPENDFIRYFPSGLGPELAALADRGFRYMPPESPPDGIGVIISTAHGGDQSSRFWRLRHAGMDRPLVAAWLWDNHLAQLNNFRTVLAADIFFPSHVYAAQYLFNPASVLGTHLPACSAQWSRAEAAKLYAEHSEKPRRHKVLVNYVDYGFSWRSALLRQLKNQMEMADVLLMPPADRSRYFGLGPAERFAEWAAYKATLILPVDRDLSTRVFDALLAGLVPIVPRNIADFDQVLPPPLQESLGIVRVESLDIASLRQAAMQALRNFDAQGQPGALARHRHALEQHMLVHRLGFILDAVRKIGTAEYRVEFGAQGCLQLLAG